jgi:hypothetical protein
MEVETDCSAASGTGQCKVSLFAPQPVQDPSQYVGGDLMHLCYNKYGNENSLPNDAKTEFGGWSWCGTKARCRHSAISRRTKYESGLRFADDGSALAVPESPACQLLKAGPPVVCSMALDSSLEEMTNSTSPFAATFARRMAVGSATDTLSSALTGEMSKVVRLLKTAGPSEIDESEAQSSSLALEWLSSCQFVRFSAENLSPAFCHALKYSFLWQAVWLSILARTCNVGTVAFTMAFKRCNRRYWRHDSCCLHLRAIINRWNRLAAVPLSEEEKEKDTAKRAEEADLRERQKAKQALFEMEQSRLKEQWPETTKVAAYGDDEEDDLNLVLGL